MNVRLRLLLMALLGILVIILAIGVMRAYYLCEASEQGITFWSAFSQVVGPFLVYGLGGVVCLSGLVWTIVYIVKFTEE